MTLRAASVVEPVAVTLTATFGGAIETKVIITPAAGSLLSFSMVPVRIQAGEGAEATMTLDRPAPAGGSIVTLGSSSNAVQLPATVVIPEGATSASFSIATRADATPGDVTISATLGTATRSVQVTLVPSTTAPRRRRSVASFFNWLNPNRPVRASMSLAVSSEPSALRAIAPDTATANSTRKMHLYTPELNLMAETDLSAAVSPASAYEYIWFAGKPVAQVDVATSTTHWTFTDHLGTPIAQTNSSATIDWRVEYEPFGTVYAFRTGSTRHQPLRFPGQEFESLDGNGEREYNIFRWYREEWGRYTQADPLGLIRRENLYVYVGDDPIDSIDPLGLARIYGNWCGPDWTGGWERPWNALTRGQRNHVLPPVDALDEACQLHDLCYGGCGREFPCKSGKRSECFRGCDVALTERAFEFGGIWGNAIGSAIDRPSRRDPGPNASDCPCNKPHEGKDIRPNKPVVGW